jgi:hypothetical protein
MLTDYEEKFLVDYLSYPDEDGEEIFEKITSENNLDCSDLIMLFDNLDLEEITRLVETLSEYYDPEDCIETIADKLDISISKYDLEDIIAKMEDKDLEDTYLYQMFSDYLEEFQDEEEDDEWDI